MISAPIGNYAINWTLNETVGSTGTASSVYIDFTSGSNIYTPIVVNLANGGCAMNPAITSPSLIYNQTVHVNDYVNITQMNPAIVCTLYQIAAAGSVGNTTINSYKMSLNMVFISTTGPTAITGT
jgi:hypothetical protein